MATLVSFHAHPDDEAGAFGGSLRLYADRGVKTFVVCLTDGQAASNRGDAKSGDELGRIRRDEFDRPRKTGLDGHGKHHTAVRSVFSNEGN